MLDLGAEAGIERPREGIVVERDDDLHVAEDVHLGEPVLEIDRNDGREPAVAMHDRGTPAQPLDRLEHAARKEDRAFVVVGEPPLIVRQHRLAGEIVVIVDEVDLHAGRGNRSHLDDELVVVVVDDQVSSRQPDHLVKLVAALVDTTVRRHVRPNLVPPLLHRLHQLPAQHRLFGLGKIGGNLLTHV